MRRKLPPQTVAHFADDGPDNITDLPHLLAEIVHQSGRHWRGVGFCLTIGKNIAQSRSKRQG